MIQSRFFRTLLSEREVTMDQINYFRLDFVNSMPSYVYVAINLARL